MIRRVLAIAALAAMPRCTHLPAPSPADAQLAAESRKIAEGAAAAGAFSGVVLVAGPDGTLFEGAYGLADRSANRPNTLATSFDIASVGKMFTGVAVAQLAERGLVDFDQPVGRYLPPALAQTEIGRKVTLHQLLTHTAGVPDLPDPLFNAPPPSLSGYTPFFQTSKLEFEPGAKRAYSNAGFVLLGMVIEQVSGESYEQYLREHLFRPAGMTSVCFRRAACASSSAVGYSRESETSAWQPNTSKIAAAAGPHGGALVTARDLVKFFTALRGGKLLSAAMSARATTPRAGAEAAYGFGTIAFERDRLVGHSGGNSGASADAYTYWNSGYSIIVLSNFDPPASHDVARAIRKLLEPRFGAK
ncbi:MAG TPA: serine hydrolase domain-containing protein [Thermoanaerobaculia bacterium]|jgi:CubicO group peptidase (beta-lactamase class C family)